jgi:hypothetical protein
MPTPSKPARTTPVRKPRFSSGNSSAKRQFVATNRGERHLGATEDQVSATMPPKAADDEPKQG